jgi:hypothetical protein
LLNDNCEPQVPRYIAFGEIIVEVKLAFVCPGKSSQLLLVGHHGAVVENLL